MNHIFITGERGVGKSTLVKKVLDALNVTPSGFLTVKGREDFGVYIYAISNPFPIFDESTCVGVRNGSGCFKAFPIVFDIQGVSILSQVNQSEIIVMDELGVMENDARLFCDTVLNLLDSSQPILGVIKPKVTPFLEAIRNHPNTKVLTLTPSNRESLFYEVLNEFV